MNNREDGVSREAKERKGITYKPRHQFKEEFNIRDVYRTDPFKDRVIAERPMHLGIQFPITREPLASYGWPQSIDCGESRGERERPADSRRECEALRIPKPGMRSEGSGVYSGKHGSNRDRGRTQSRGGPGCTSPPWGHRSGVEDPRTRRGDPNSLPPRGGQLYNNTNACMDFWREP